MSNKEKFRFDSEKRSLSDAHLVDFFPPLTRDVIKTILKILGKPFEKTIEQLSKSITVTKPVFIVGCQRSGTTTFYNLFVEHPEVAYYPMTSEISPECPITFYYLYKLIRRTRRLIAEENHAYLRKLLSPADPGMLIPPQTDEVSYETYPEQAKLEQLLKSVKKHLWLFKAKRFACKNYLGGSMIEVLNALFPDSYFIHIIRDGRAVAYSLLKKRIEQNGDPHKVWAAYPRKWKDLERMDPIISCATQWKRIIRDIQANLSEIEGQRKMDILYEEYVSNPREVLRRTWDFTDLPFDPKFLEPLPDEMENRNYKVKEQLSEERYSELTEYLKDELVDLNYA